MRVECTLSEKDFVAAQRAHRPSGIFLPIVGGLLILAGIVTLMSDRKNLGSSLEPFLLGFGLVSLQRVLWSYQFRKDKRLHDPFGAEITDQGIEISAPAARAKFEWKAFIRFAETKKLFVLYHGPNVFNIFPKRCFGAGEVDAFRSLVQEKLGHHAAKSRKALSPITWVFVIVVSVAFLLMLITIRNTLRQSSPVPQPAQTQSTN